MKIMFNKYKKFFFKNRYPSLVFYFILAIFTGITIISIKVNLDGELLTFTRESTSVKRPVISSIGPISGKGLSPTKFQKTSLSFTETLSETLSVEIEIVHLLNLINDYREDKNLNPLALSVALTAAADWMSQDMADKNYFSHTDSLGRDPFTRMCDFGYCYNTWKGENLVAGCDTPQYCLDIWKNSPGHNAILLNENFVVIGLGRAYNQNSNFGWYWAADFGGYLDETIPTSLISPCLVYYQGNLVGGAGDVNNDGDISSVDALYVAQAVVGLIPPLSGNQAKRADVDASGNITITDSLLITQYIVGSISTFPICHADFVVKSPIYFSPRAPVNGEVMSFSGIVKNNGSGTAGASKTRLRIDIKNDGIWDVLPGHKYTGSLVSGATETETWSNIWTAKAGTHKFEICADIESAVKESNESNNCTSQIFTVGIVDGFGTASIDTELWGVSLGGGSTASQKDGVLTIAVPNKANAFADFYSKVAFPVGSVFETRFFFSEGQDFDYRGLGFANSRVAGGCDKGETEAALQRGINTDERLETKKNNIATCSAVSVNYLVGWRRIKIVRVDTTKVQFYTMSGVMSDYLLIATHNVNIPQGNLPIRFSAFVPDSAPTYPITIKVDWVKVTKP